MSGHPRRIEAARLMRLLRRLARFGGQPGGGVSRPGFGQADTDGRHYLARVGRRSGLTTRIDEAGNLIFGRAQAVPDKAVLLMGSHLDTVDNGGWLDGTYGVVAALEVLRALADDPRPMRYEPAVIAFANEEGAQFPQPFFGSLALAGQLRLPTTTVDRDGRSLRDLLRAAGGDLDQIHRACWPPDSVGAYLELHIEQGPVLEQASVPIGLVSAITGRTILDVKVTGQQGHAGTVPMELRRDAVAAAARVVLATEGLARERKLCRVATVGVLDPEPNVANVIAGEARLTVELRDIAPQRLVAAEAALRADVAKIASGTGILIEIEPRMRADPVPTHPALRTAIAAAATDLGHSYLEMPSGAGHDAQIVSQVAPIGMLFVPSRGGVSHSPAEDTDPDHLIAGANTLLHTALRLSTTATP